MDREQLLQLVADLYIEGHSATEIAKILQKKCENPPHVATIYRWIKKHKESKCYKVKVSFLSFYF